MPIESNPLSQWRDIDEEPVPVRAAAPVRSVPVTRSEDVRTHRIGTQWNIRLSAITGIVLALIAIGFYFGIDSLRGDLLDDAAATTVTITADGHFSPNEMEVVAGTTITIKNENENPQVLKSTGVSELFPAQVVFGDPFTYDIPVSVDGTFTYVSETLPASEVLTIIVHAGIETAAVEESSSSGEFQTTSDEIPIPFGDLTPPPMSSAETPVFTEQPVSSSAGPTVHSDDVPTINLLGGKSAPAPTEGTASLPENPFTVSWGRDNPGANPPVKVQEKLHSGAPLQTVYPRTVTETGPRVWMLFIPAFLLLGLFYRKITA